MDIFTRTRTLTEYLKWDYLFLCALICISFQHRLLHFILSLELSQDFAMLASARSSCFGEFSDKCFKRLEFC